MLQRKIRSISKSTHASGTHSFLLPLSHPHTSCVTYPQTMLTYALYPSSHPSLTCVACTCCQKQLLSQYTLIKWYSPTFSASMYIIIHNMVHFTYVVEMLKYFICMCANLSLPVIPPSRAFGVFTIYCWVLQCRLNVLFSFLPSHAYHPWLWTNTDGKLIHNS